MIRDDEDGTPRVMRSARGLGVRGEEDIPIDEDGMVEPGTGGMSVSPDSLHNLPPHRRPPRHGGTGPDPVWELDEQNLSAGLAFRLDDDLEGHGFVEPGWRMELETYEELLAETRAAWVECA